MDQPRFPGYGLPVGRSPVKGTDLASQDPSVMQLRPVANSDAFLLAFLQTTIPPKPAPAATPIEMPTPIVRSGPSLTSRPAPISTAHLVNRSPVVAYAPGMSPLPFVSPSNSDAALNGLLMGVPLPPAVQNIEYVPDSQSTSAEALSQGVDISHATHIGQAPVTQDVIEGLSDGQVRAIQAVLAGKNILLTGPAGTGKSHTIKKITEIFEKRNLKVAVTSTTGASAILIEGKTIHSWSGIGICGSKESALKRVMTYKKPQERIQGASLLIIDEVSMLSGIMLDILDYIFRMVRSNQQSFGGIQVVLCGDFYQLKPVKSDSYTFDAPNWSNLIHEVHELTFIFRQDNAQFCKALNEIRTGDVSTATVELLAGCLGRKFEGDIQPTELYPTNDDVSWLNENELWKLATEQNMVHEIPANDEFIERPRPRRARDPKFFIECQERLDKDCMAPRVLHLLVGAQVMLIKNLNVDAGLANGSRGVVVGFGNQGEPVVKFRNGHIINMQTCLWVMRMNETTKGKRTQYPLKLAWAISIHKAQGCTIDLLKVDLGCKIFEAGQTYTALSRVRTLEGLSIIALDWEKVLTNKRVKEFYAKYRK